MITAESAAKVHENAGGAGAIDGNDRQNGGMSVVKNNAISIPEDMGPQLEERFAGRSKMVEQFEGFEDFQLLRPTEGEARYFVYTRWATEADFQNWMNSQNFEQGHGATQADGNNEPRQPVGRGAERMAFDVVEHIIKGA